MKKNLLFVLLAVTITSAACRREALHNADNDQQTATSSGSAAKGDDDTDAAYCTCNPCNPNVHFGNVNAELSPKLNCYEECNGYGYNLTTLNLYYESLYSQPCFYCNIPLDSQLLIIQRAAQKAVQYRPSGKLIINITLGVSYVDVGGVTYYYVYPVVTYGSCSPIDPD